MKTFLFTFLYFLVVCSALTAQQAALNSTSYPSVQDLKQNLLKIIEAEKSFSKSLPPLTDLIVAGPGAYPKYYKTNLHVFAGDYPGIKVFNNNTTKWGAEIGIYDSDEKSLTAYNKWHELIAAALPDYKTDIATKLYLNHNKLFADDNNHNVVNIFRYKTADNISHIQFTYNAPDFEDLAVLSNANDKTEAAKGDRFFQAIVAEKDGDYKTAFKLFSKLDKSLPRTSIDFLIKYHLGLCYRYGLGIWVDDFKARNYLEIAGLNGVAEASYEMGLIFIDKGYVELALQRLHDAAEQGSEVGKVLYEKELAYQQAHPRQIAPAAFMLYPQDKSNAGAAATQGNAPSYKKWCFECKGTGKVHTTLYGGTDYKDKNGYSVFGEYNTCPDCRGKGYIVR